jgi:hypothetical protein
MCVTRLGAIMQTVEPRLFLIIPCRDFVFSIFTLSQFCERKRENQFGGFQMHCPECGAAEGLTFYKGRHLCPACLMRIERVRAIPKNATPASIREMAMMLDGR